MNKLIINGKTEVAGMKFHDVEGGFGERKKAMLVKDIAEIHGKELKHINEAINSNRKRFKDEVEIIDLKSVDLIDRDLLKELGFSNGSIANSKSIYILSERGYSKLLKILEDDVAWEQYEKLVDGYFNMRAKTKHEYDELSPQLQLLINIELKQNQMQQELENTNQKIDGIRQIVGLNPSQWRKEASVIINKIAKNIGGYNLIKDVYEEVYDLLEQRFGVNLSIRLENKKKNSAYKGTNKTKIDKINKLDVIAEDKKLIEGYISVVKELAIKYDIVA